MTNAVVTPLPEHSTDWTIGKNVAVLLVRTDERQANLAGHLGISAQSMSQKVKGKRPWTSDELEGTARFFGVSIDSLFKKLPGLDSNQEPIG